MKFFIYLLIGMMQLFMINHSVALVSSYHNNKTVMVPGTGLIAGNISTNKYFIVEDKKNLPVIKASKSINKSNTYQHYQIKSAFKRIHQKSLPASELQRIRLAIHRAIDKNQSKKELLKIVAMLKHPQLAKSKKPLVQLAGNKMKHY